MKDLIGSKHYNEILSDELLVISYDYNNQEPRFFSKTFMNRDPAIYNVTLGNSTAASSAAPTFFDPKIQIDKYGFVELQIDGGIIANNPALNSYTIAKKFRHKKNIRVVSLGTGEKPFKPFDHPELLEKIDFMKMSGEFMMNMDTYTVEWYLNQTVFDKNPKDYLRLQIDTPLAMDKSDKKTLDGLEENGLEVWRRHEDEMKDMLRRIIDDKEKINLAKKATASQALQTPVVKQVDQAPVPEILNLMDQEQVKHWTLMDFMFSETQFMI